MDSLIHPSIFSLFWKWLYNLSKGWSWTNKYFSRCLLAERIFETLSKEHEEFPYAEYNFHILWNINLFILLYTWMSSEGTEWWKLEGTVLLWVFLTPTCFAGYTKNIRSYWWQRPFLRVVFVASNPEEWDNVSLEDNGQVSLLLAIKEMIP